MKRSIPILFLAVLIICWPAFSQTPVPGAFVGASGNSLVNAKVIKFDGENFVVEHDGGISNIPWDRAPEAVRAKYTRSSAAGVAIAPRASVVPSPAPSSPKVAPDTAPTRERKVARYAFAFTPPDGWESISTPPGPIPFQMAFRSPDRKRIVGITADDRWKYGDIDDYQISEWERGFQNKGGKKPIWTKNIQIAGKPGYQRRGVTVVGALELPTIILMVAHGGMNYTMLATCDVAAEPGEDDDTQKFLSSFRFLTTPLPGSP